MSNGADEPVSISHRRDKPPRARLPRGNEVLMARRRGHVEAMMVLNPAVTVHALVRQLATLDPPIQAAPSSVISDMTHIRKMWVKGKPATREAYLAQELILLGRLQEALVPKALNGDIRATEMALEISDRRRKLLGLDEPTQTLQQAPNQLIISLNESSNWRGLPSGEHRIIDAE